MSIAEKIAERVAGLPIERQAEIPDFVEFLAARHQQPGEDWPHGAFREFSLEQLQDDDPVEYELSDCREPL